MRQAQLAPQPALPAKVSPFVKGVANNNVKAEADGYPPGATEPPLPVTRERLELIKACAKGSPRTADEAATSRIAERFAPRAPSAPLPGPASPAGLAPPPGFAGPASPMTALTSGIRTLTAVLVLAALLPNLTLAVFWLGLIDPPWAQVASLAPREAPHPPPKPSLPSPVLSAPTGLDALPGETVSFPLALDGTDGVPDRSIIVVKGLPPGSKLSEGLSSGDTEWRLTPDQIGDLHLVVTPAAIGESTLLVQLVTPDDSTIATTSTTLRTRVEPVANPGDYAVEDAKHVIPEPTQAAAAQVAEAGEAAADVEETSATLETASLETVPLPDRRPTPPPRDANWIKPTAYVNLRESPSSTAAVVSIVAKGAKLRVLSRKRGWVQVNNPADSRSGWIYANNIAVSR
jgi:hypothetical protein